MTVHCKCGWRDTSSTSVKQAEVIADVHESTARNPHRHGPRRGEQSMIVGDFWTKYEELRARTQAAQGVTR